MDLGQFLTRNALKTFLAGIILAVILMLCMSAGYSYSDSTEFCSSCHSMNEYAANWQTSNHKQFKCTECHLPQDNMIDKMVAKTETGLNDTYHEFMRDYPAEIKLTAKGKDIVNGNCLRCHQSTVENTFMAESSDNCLKCHTGLVHHQFTNKGGIKIE